MKRLVLAIAAAMVMSYGMAQNSQEKKGPREMTDAQKTEMAQKQTDRMVKDLGLNTKQAAALLDLNKEYAGKMGMGHPHGPRQEMDGKGGKPGNPPQMDKDQKGQMPKMDKEQMEKMRKEHQAQKAEYETKLQKIIGADAFKKYQSDMAKHRPAQKTNDAQ